MSELSAQISLRARDALASLRQATAEDDHHLAEIRLGELDSLARTAFEHGLEVPELESYQAMGA